MHLSKLHIIFLFVTVIVSNSDCVFAQTNPYNEVSIASPTAASLGKYADIPVNYHTGIPSISIPVYTVKEGPLSLPISINYHASGLKVMEPASWVGAGWSLDAGGVITRTVQGAPDERQTSNTYNQTHGHLSDGGYNQYLWTATNAPPQEPPSWAPKYERQDWDMFAEGKKDGEPDLFFFNFAGFSGKFYFHDDGSAVLVPEQDMKVEYNYTPGLGNSIESFTITTQDGTKYYFGKTVNTADVDPIEITNPYTSNTGLSVGTAISSWFLNKIVSADNLFSITLAYTAENYSYYTTSMFAILADENRLTGYNSVKNIIKGVRLSQIKFSNGQIDFVPSSTVRLDLNGNASALIDDANTEAKSLGSIEISTGDVTPCNWKKFVFSYDYFVDNTSELAPGLVNITTDKKRLKLNSVKEQSCGGLTEIPPHQFEYFTNFVPRRLSFAQDHWGFYNGATGNTTLIPTFTLNTFTTVAGANRDASFPAMENGALKKITYPTGGYSEFEFEQNYTWVNYNHSEWQYRFSINAGYDGSSLTVPQNQVFTSNSYRLNFSNPSYGSQALLNIYNSSGTQVKGYVLEAGQTLKDEIIQFSAGTYRIELQKLGAVSSHGAQATFEEWTYAPVQKNETVGGLRIKILTFNDGIQASNNIVTSYTYKSNDNKSTGVLYSRPAYIFKIRNDLIRDIGYQDGPSCSSQGCVSCDGYNSVTFLKSPVGIRPMETTQGNHIGYSEVKVSQTGKGYAIYRYYGSNVWDLNTDDVAYRSIANTGVCEASVTNFPFAPLPHEFMRGELKYVGQFNDSGQVLHELTYYPVFQNNPKTTPAFIATSDYGNGYVATFYTLSTAKKTQTQVTETTYTPRIGSVQSNSYSYFESAYHNQVTRKKDILSTGEILESKYKYAGDFRIPNCDAISDCLQSYNDALSAALSLYNSRKLSCGDHTCRWWAWQAYIKDKSLARINYVSCRRTNYTGTNSAFNSAHTNAKNAADLELKPILELQDEFKNPVIETSSYKNNNLISASFNRFDYGMNGSTFVYPNKLQTIFPSSLAATFANASTSSSATSLTKDSRYSDERFYKFNLGSPAEVTGKDGVTTSYIWGYGNTLPIVKAVSVDAVTLSAAYTAVAGNLTQLRTQSSLANALISTYTYSPLIGMTSETDPSGKIISYEYDKLGRLTVIKDQNGSIIKKYEYKYVGQ